MKITVFFLAPLCAAALLSAQGAEPQVQHIKLDVSQLPPAAEKKDVSYLTDIKPILDKSCVRCHAAGKAKAKLRLDSLESALRGGESGKAIEPGNSAGSRLVADIAFLGPKDKHMPPPGNKAGIKPLAKEEIGLIRAWIDQGAK